MIYKIPEIANIIDFGVVLGCRLYIKEMNSKALMDKDGCQDGVQEGDLVMKINNLSTEGMSLKDAKKLMENCKDRLSLVIKRDPFGSERFRASSQDPIYGSSSSKGEEKSTTIASFHFKCENY